MPDLTKIRRIAAWGALCLAALSGVALALAHTSAIQRLAFSQVQAVVRDSYGIALEAGRFDYNLLASRIEFERVTLQGAGLQDMPSPVAAERIIVSIPLWKLALGSFQDAQIRVQGLVATWATTLDGRSNWPPLTGRNSGEISGVPAVFVTSGNVAVDDKRNAFSLRLPIERLVAAWDPARNVYGIAVNASRGQLKWRDADFALNTVETETDLSTAGVRIHSLQLVSGASRARLHGSVQGSRSNIEANGEFDVDTGPLGQALRIATPVSGRIQGLVSVKGPIEDLQITARLSGERIILPSMALSRVAAEARVDAKAGEVIVPALDFDVFSGHFTGSGRIRTKKESGRSELTAALAGFDPGDVTKALGSDLRLHGSTTAKIAATWPDTDWRRATVSIAINSQGAVARVKAQASPESIQASLQISLGRGAELRGDIGINHSDHALSGDITGDVANLSDLGRKLAPLLGRPLLSSVEPAVGGSARWSASLHGTIDHPAALVKASVDELAVGSWRNAGVDLEAECGLEQIEIRRLLLKWSGQQLELQGRVVSPAADPRLDLQGSLVGESLAPVLANAGWNDFADAHTSGNVRISGRLMDPELESSIDFLGLTAFGLAFRKTTVDAAWRQGELHITRLHSEDEPESAALGHLDATGSWVAATSEYRFDLAAENLRVKDIFPGPRTAGAFMLEARGAGTFANPAFTAKVMGSEIQIGGLALGELRGEVAAKDGRATAVLFAPAVNAHATSSVVLQEGWPFEARIEAENTKLPTNPAASFDASIQGSGRLLQPRLERMTAAIRNLRVNTEGEEIAADGPIEVSLADDRVQVKGFNLTSGDSKLSLSGAVPLDKSGVPGSLALDGRIVLDRFARLLPGVDASKTGGIAEVKIALSGSTQDWEPLGSVEIHDGRVGWPSVPFVVERISGRLEIKDGIVRVADGIAGNAGTGTVHLDGSVPLHLLSNTFRAPDADPGQPARFSGRIDGLHWTAGTGQNAASASAAIHFQGQASAFSADAVRATVEFPELALKSAAGELRQAEPTRIAVADGIARVDTFVTKGTNASITASGSIGLTGGHDLKFEAAGNADLTLLSAFVPRIEAAGSAQFNVRLSGSVAEPRASGFVALEGASLALPEPPIQAAGVKLRATLDGDEIAFQEIGGTLNGGPFSGGGTLKLAGGKLVGGNLSLSAHNVFLEYPAGVKTTSSLEVKLAARQERPLLAGRVEIQEGYYEASLEDLGSTSGATRSWSQQPETSAGSLALDVGIVTKRPVEMDNNLGRLAASADLRLAGTAAHPRLTGKLELEPDGRIYFGDRTYYVERGAVRFLDPAKITPELDIEAYTRASDYTVRLRLAGELNEVTTTFTSDPPLSRDDIIAVLLTGKTVAENRGVDLRSLEGLALATGAMNASLSSRARRRMGVSRVSIQPAAVAAESNPGARITITQDFTRTLRLMYSMNLSDSNDQIWVTEYDLSNRFTTRAVKQSDNTYRGEFRHDVRFGSSTMSGRPAGRMSLPVISRVDFTGGGPFADAELAKHFKVKPGQKANAIKLRKATDKLSKFLTENRRLESRVRLDRAEDGGSVALTARIDLGPTVTIDYQGATPSRGQRKRIREVWHNGISDQQRPRVAKEALLDYFAAKGYLLAKVTPEVSSDGDHKHVRFDLEPGTRYRGVKIVLEGAGRSHNREILALLDQRQLRLSVYRDGRRASRAIARYYEQRGYLAAEIGTPRQELNPNAGSGRIVLPIREGPLFRIGVLAFTGNAAIASDELRRAVPLQAGAVFEPARLDPSIAALKLQYGKLGFGEADIDYEIARHDESASIDVSFTISENKQTTIGAIKVEGNRQTSADFARSQVQVAEGGVADTSLIRESARNLARTGAYASTDLRLQPPVEAGAADQRLQVADLVVAVNEPKPFRLLYGGLYDSGGGPGFIADLQNRNSLGPGRVLGLRTRVDPETDEVRVYVTRPFWRQLRLTTTISTYFTREIETYQAAPTDTLGASIQQDLPLRSKWLLSYGYRFEKQRGFIPDPAAPDVKTDVAYVAPLTLTLSRDARDSFLDATKGSFLSHGFELAPHFLGSNYPYARYYVQYFKYFPLTRPRSAPFGDQLQRSRLVFATGSRLGFQKGFSEEGAVLTDRFYAGGGTTVRGFRQDELGPKLASGQPAGGNAVLVLNEEIRYPLFWIFDGVTFVDVGNVFPRVTDFRLSDLRAAGGFGLRVRNPFVVIRFDYGFKFDRRPGEKPGAFFFSIGQAF